MRSSAALPGNPWPHDMVLTVDDNSQTLVDLLWIREAWGLHPTENGLPPLLSDTPPPTSELAGTPPRIAWQDAWPTLWEARLRHDGLILDASLFEQLGEAASGSHERGALLRQLRGPLWQDAFGDEAFTEAHRTWSDSRFESVPRRHPRGRDESPEWVSLAPLVAAWQAGLEKIVTIPCLGTYTRVIGPHALLVTSETRDDPQRYSEALEQFRQAMA